MSRESSSSASAVAVWSSVALFVASAAVSVSLCREEERHPKRGRQKSRFDYSLRRSQSRLSPPHDSRKSIFAQHAARHDEEQQPHEDILLSLDDADYHPKNQNWKHFESANASDVEDGIVTPSASSFQDSDEDTSSSASDEFVWTQPRVAHWHVARTNEKSLHHDTYSGSSNNLEENEFPVKDDEAKERATAWTQIRQEMVRSVGSLTTFGKVAEEEELESSAESFISADESIDAINDLEEEKQPSRSNINETDPILRNRRLGLEPSSSMWDILSRSIPDMLCLERYTTAPQEQKPEIAAYNASILPSKVVLIRHGQSEGNVNESLYATTPDNAMRITKLGWDQAHMAGKALKEKVLASGESIHFIVSPYVRTVETFHGIVSAWCDPSEFNHIEDRDERIKAWYGRLLEMGLTWHEDPRIREQDFGNYQDPAKIKKCKAERHKFGVFFYRFPHGESASDVFDRVSTFLDSLWRSFDLQKSRNYVLITHGISIRVFLARYFRYSIDQFSMLANPKNGEMVILGHDGKGKLKLQGRCEMQLHQDEGSDEQQVTGYKFHKRLRVLPKSAIRKGNIRVSFDD